MNFLKPQRLFRRPSIFGAALTTLLLALATTENGRGVAGTVDRKKIVCYYMFVAEYRSGGAKLSPDAVDPFLCTHVIFAFPDPKIISPFPEPDAHMASLYRRLNSIKRRNPALKTMVAVGGWAMGSGPFQKMVATEKSRAQYIDSTIKFLRKYDFDGIDLDWEYPASRGSPPADRHRFSLLCHEFRSAFERESRATDNERLLVIAAVAAGWAFVAQAYEIPAIAASLDWINLMAYEFHGGWERETGIHVPFNAAGPSGRLTAQWSTENWIRGGMPPEKIVLGMATYGRSFTLVNPTVNNIRSPSSGAGKAGRLTKSAGLLSYYEICDNLKNHRWQSRFSTEEGAMYAFGGDQWVGYDDINSLAIKLDFINARGLGGGFIWSMDLDDFTGEHCGQGAYPLVTLVKNRLNGALPSTPVWAPEPPLKAEWAAPGVAERPLWGAATTEAPWRPIEGGSTVWVPWTPSPWGEEPAKATPSWTEEEENSTPAPVRRSWARVTDEPAARVTRLVKGDEDAAGGKCEINGAYMADPGDCNAYMQCVHVGSVYEKRLRFRCPEALAFNPRLTTCDLRENVPECRRKD